MPLPAIDAEPRTLIDALLAEQQSLTAVQRFSRTQERAAQPSQHRYYKNLIPLSKPEPGEQYAFAVDLDLCTGCKACVSACHSLNGLDEDEIWRNIGLIHGGAEQPYQQTITTACHHCVEPGCMLGCPVQAYDKDAETGIVRHLDDQCIGCQYCVLKCPYDVPKYSQSRGIVRKCDMCYGRLKVGEAPACVQSCPSGAITIRIVAQAELLESIEPGDAMLPGAYDSSYTKPATLYSSRREIPAAARPGDDAALRLEHPHWPLIGMLILTQSAAGILLGIAVIAAFHSAVLSGAAGLLSLAAFALLNLGLAVSVLHLGRPLGAWRAFLGLRTSWMSREIFAFSAFAGAAAALVGATCWDFAAHLFPKLHAFEFLGSPASFTAPAAFAAGACGILGVFCSAMIYVDTRRAYWSRAMVFTKFYGTTALLGAAGVSAVLGGIAAFTHEQPMTATVLSNALFLALRVALFAWEATQLRAMLANAGNANHRSGKIIWDLLRPQLTCGIILAAGSMISALLSLSLAGTPAAFCAALTFLLACGSQIVERYFFFTAVVAYRMPGPLAPARHSSSHA